MRTCSAQRVREGTARKVASDAVKALTQRLPLVAYQLSINWMEISIQISVNSWNPAAGREFYS